MIAVVADNLARILMHALSKFGFLVPILPARSCHDDEQTKFVAGIHETWILRIVSHAYNATSGIAQTLGIAPLLRVWQSISDISKILMSVCSDELC